MPPENATATESHPTQVAEGSARRAITRSVVGLIKEHLGKGPVKAKTYIYEDSVLILMFDGHTTSEETLSDGGEAEAVASQRVKASEAIRERLTDVVEAELGRHVIGYLSSSQQHPSLLSYVFVLDSTDLIEARAENT